MKFVIPVKTSIISSLASCISKSSLFGIEPIKVSRHNHFKCTSHTSHKTCSYSINSNLSIHPLITAITLSYKVSDDSSFILSTQILIYLSDPKSSTLFMITFLLFSHKISLNHVTCSTILSRSKSYPMSYPMPSPMKWQVIFKPFMCRN